MCATVKWRQRFGKLLRQQRLRLGIPRVVLAARLGVAKTTMADWEFGRCFIENLEILPILGRELKIDPVKMIIAALGPKALAPPSTMGALPVEFVLRGPGKLRSQRDEWLAVPLVRLREAKTSRRRAPPFETVRHVLVPADWGGGKRGKNLMAFTVKDAQMEPILPRKAIAVVNAVPCDETRFNARKDVVAAFLDGLGVRMRHIVPQPKGCHKLVPRPGKCGFFTIRPHRDLILGRVVGIIARVSRF